MARGTLAATGERVLGPGSDSITLTDGRLWFRFSLVYLDLTPQQQPGSYQGGEMMMK